MATATTTNTIVSYDKRPHSSQASYSGDNLQDPYVPQSSYRQPISHFDGRVSHNAKLLEELRALDVRDKTTQELDVGNSLVVSPYTTPSHLLDLDSVSPACQHLAKALKHMRAVRPDFATAPYIESFNWSSIIDALRESVSTDTSFQWKEQVFYIVVFKSQIPPSTDRSHLGALDELAHAEAMESGGLLKYWFGVPDSTGRNLATCVWRELQDSKIGSTGKGHKQAARETRVLYTEWRIDRLGLKISDNAKTWEIVDWID